MGAPGEKPTQECMKPSNFATEDDCGGKREMKNEEVIHRGKG